MLIIVCCCIFVRRRSRFVLRWATGSTLAMEVTLLTFASPDGNGSPNSCMAPANDLCLQDSWKNWINWDAPFRDPSDELNRQRRFFWEVDEKARPLTDVS